MDTRYGRVQWGGPGKGTGTRVRTSEHTWNDPLRWNRKAQRLGTRPFVFCASLADIFDNAVLAQWRRDAFDVMRRTPALVYLLLTKRPQMIERLAEEAGGLPPNCALGTTVEDQERAINLFHLACAARDLAPLFTFASFEPLLGAVDPTRVVLHEGAAEFLYQPEIHTARILFDALRGAASMRLPALGWVITGGETDQGAHKARPTHPDWFRSMRDQAAAAGVPFHLKQMTNKGEVPTDLQIQERPHVA
jgi:protein gp37